MFLEFVQENSLLFIALAVIVVMLIYSYVGDKLAGFASVSPEEATRLYNDGATLLDVRTPEEYKSGRIGEAMNLPISQFAQKVESLKLDKSKPIVVYCQTGARSARAAGILTKQGYEKVYNLAGGIMAWKAAGLPVNMPKSKKAAKKKS